MVDIFSIHPLDVRGFVVNAYYLALRSDLVGAKVQITKTDNIRYFDKTRDLLPTTFFKEKINDKSQNLVKIIFPNRNSDQNVKRLLSLASFREKIVQKIVKT